MKASLDMMPSCIKDLWLNTNLTETITGEQLLSIRSCEYCLLQQGVLQHSEKPLSQLSLSPCIQQMNAGEIKYCSYQLAVTVQVQTVNTINQI